MACDFVVTLQYFEECLLLWVDPELSGHLPMCGLCRDRLKKSIWA